MTEMKHSESDAVGAAQVHRTSRWTPPVVHLLLSIGVISCVALLIFGVWFPAPFRGLVIAIQLAALAYGMYALSLSRPLAMVYEVDRFRLISYADVEEAEGTTVPDWAHPWRFSDVRVVGTRTATTLDEKLNSVEASLQGVEPSQRPEWWQDYAQSVPRVLQRARPLSELRQKHPTEQGILDSAVKQALADVRPGETTDAAQLRWLPLVSRRAMNWVVLLDPSTARPRGYAALDGF